MKQLVFPVTKKEAEKRGVSYSSENNKNALFPSRLRTLRAEKGISQAAFATALGVSKSTIGLYETGDTLPDAKTLYDMAKYFSVTSDYLLGLSDADKQEFHDFAEATHFSRLTLSNLAALSGYGIDGQPARRKRAAFEYLLITQEFSEIITLLQEYLDMKEIVWPKGNTDKLLELYGDADKKISEITGGNLHIATSALLAETLLTKAQNQLRSAFEQVKGNVDKCGGWKQYMPY